MQPVTISYASLVEKKYAELAPAIADAFGSQGLGILVVKDLPASFQQLRHDCLEQAYRFASLPEDVCERYADESSSYSFGWSLGKEHFNGRPDLLKGSYYAHPTMDSRKNKTKDGNPAYSNDNIWPDEDCPGYSQAFKALSTFMLEVGVEVAKLVDFALQIQGKSIANMIASSTTSKARLLHYFPVPGQELNFGDSQQTIAKSTTDDICANHLDHSLLTALCPAQYRAKMLDTGLDYRIPCPSETAGLFITPRGAKKSVRVTYPADCLAFQTGEAIQLLSNGKLAATPHRVTAGDISPIPDPRVVAALPSNISGNAQVSRQTMAVFLQPEVDEQLTKDETFGQFTERILKSHYVS